jgi:hypothetical protein
LGLVGFYAAISLWASSQKALERLVSRRVADKVDSVIAGFRDELNEQLAEISNKLTDLATVSQEPEEVKSKHKITDARLTDGEGAYRYFAMRYGIGYKQLDVDCTIRLDGSARVRRTVEVEAFSQTKQLDTFLLIPESPPSDREWDIDLLAARSLSPDFSVSIPKVLEQDGKLSAKLEISPQLGEGQQIVYELVEKLPAGLYAVDFTEADLANRKTPIDYFGWTVNRPTRSLNLDVYFPVDTKPDSFGFEVRYASVAPAFPSDNYQREEEKRIRPTLIGPEGGRYCLRLCVDYPMIGLVYILSWEPLKSERGRSLTQKATIPRQTVLPHKPADSEKYNVGAIRTLVHDAFTPQKLKEFCQDSPHFKDVLIDFGAKSSLGEMADALLDYCETQNLFPELLSEIQVVNSRQYARYSAQLHHSDAPSVGSDSE